MKKSLIFIITLMPWLFFGQEKQPKVGLVLSGGGAKGFAHIGVLKEIDKAGIQLDYIGGTSMGAILGGLYAAGYSGIQIEAFVKNTDFINLLRDRLPRSSSPFFEKEYGENTAISLPVNKGSIGLPKGVSKGQNMLNLLLELFAPVEGVRDFSKLSIPFFCIATDVETGGQVLLEKGSLPLALRASGSFPTLLNPVAINKQLLIDGGVANNFPADVMRAKGMDIIIGVDVQGRLYEKEKLTSVIAILNQIVSYQMYNKSTLEKEKIDVYIHPEIYNYNVVDFAKKEEILVKGDEEAVKYKDVFKEIAAKQHHKKSPKRIAVVSKKYLISEIGISGAQNYTRAFVLGKLNLKVNDSISREEITNRIYLLSATKNYERIEYALTPKEDASFKIDFSLIESTQNASLNFALHYDRLYKSGILVNYSQKKFLLNNDVFSLDLILGDNIRYKLNYFVDNGFYTSFGIRSSFTNFLSNTKNTIVSNTPSLNSINLKYNDFTNQFFLQTTFERRFALGIGLEHQYINVSSETFATNNRKTVFDDSNYLNFFTYLKYDSYDNKLFPTIGYFADLNAKWYLLSSDFNNDFKRFIQAKGTLGFAASLGSRFTFQNTNEAGFTLNNPTSNIFKFYLGGYNKNYINTFISLYGYGFAELSQDTFLKSEFNFRYRFTNNHYALFIANYARLEPNVFKNLDLFTNIRSGYALGYSYYSFIGPIELKYSWSPDTKESYWLFNLGFWF